MRLRTTLRLALTLAVAASVGAAAPSEALPQMSRQPETINGVALRSGIERLSYISPRYFGIRLAYDDCMVQSQGVAPKQQDCAEAELAFQDGRLNKAYKALAADLNDLDKRAAIEAQRAWLTFRDKDCAARAGRFGSDAGPATESTCRMENTAYRAQQLEDWRTTLAAQPPY